MPSPGEGAAVGELRVPRSNQRRPAAGAKGRPVLAHHYLRLVLGNCRARLASERSPPPRERVTFPLPHILSLQEMVGAGALDPPPCSQRPASSPREREGA